MGLADPKPPMSRRRTSEPEEREHFKRAVLTLDNCECIVHEYPTDCEGDLQAHHVITQQQLRDAGRHDLLWDPADGATVCELAHRRHHSGSLRISRERLPRRAVRFAEMHGLTYLLERFYG